MRTFLLGPDDPGRVRFGVSAVWETIQAVRALRDPAQQCYHRRWLSLVPPEAGPHRLPGLVALTPVRGFTPDFLCPAPRTGQRPDPDRELARLRRTPIREVARGLDLAVDRAAEDRRAGLMALAADPAAALNQVADELAQAWSWLVEPWWPAVRRLLEDDMAFRSEQILRLGLEHAVNDLHPRVRWRSERVEVSGPATGEQSLAGRGLLLMPTAYGWPRVIALDPPWPPAVAYPARGIGDLWAIPEQASRPLARLLGPQRARVLVALESPCTTTDLATMLGLTAPSVSRHLTLMHATGLVARRRDGHAVPYRRTPLGDALVAGAGDG